jgi:hypothetical protein
MKNKIKNIIIFAAICFAWAVGNYDGIMFEKWRTEKARAQHEHEWGQWQTPVQDQGDWAQCHGCASCGLVERRVVQTVK